MTVSTAYSPSSFSGNGATTAFAVSWQFFTGSLVVTLVASTGVETVKTLTTHYTVAGGTDADGLPATGTVTMLTAPASGETLRITRVTPKTQAATWGEFDAFPQKVVEAAFDKATLIAQEGLIGGSDEITGDVMQLDSSGATNYWDAESHIIRNIADPVGDTDAVSKSYADANYGGAVLDGAEAAATAASASATAAATSATAAATAAASTLAAGFTWTYSTTTSMADPGSGAIRFNHATLASVTAIAVDDISADTGTPDVSATVLSWDDSTNTTGKGTLLLREVAAPQNWVQFTVTGLTDNSGWTEVAVTYLNAGGSFSNNDVLMGSFTRSGDKGADGVGAGDVVGPASATSGRVATFNGTTGKLIADGGKTIAEIEAAAAAAAAVTIRDGVAAGFDTLAELAAGKYGAGGTDVALADGGTGASLADPGADRIMFWDDSAGAVTWLTAGTGLTITGTTIEAASGTSASQAEQEAASSTSVMVTPGRQHFHPGSAKAWVKFNSAGTVAASYNITSVTDNGTGSWTVNIATDFSSANYCGVAFGGMKVVSTNMIIYNLAAAAAAGTFNIFGYDLAEVSADPTSPNEIYAVFFGDQA